MAQTNYTPISLYYSTTAATAPTAGNLVDGELAINTNDGKLYYKDSSGVVQTIASKAGNTNVSSFSGGSTGLTPSTATTGAVSLAGTLAVGYGGTGATTITGLVKGSGTSAFSAATAGTDYIAPPSGTAILKANSGGALANATAGTDYLAPPSGTALLKANSGGALANATAGTEYLAPPSGTSLLKANSGGALANATAGTDYVAPGTATTFTAKQTFSNATGGSSKFPNILEVATISATAATGTINYDTITQSILYYTTNASGNFTINVRGDGTTSLNTMMATGESLSLSFLCTNGATAYYNSLFQIDGSTVTPKWQGGAPTAGNASAVDIYNYAILKTGSAAFTVFASQTKFS